MNGMAEQFLGKMTEVIGGLKRPNNMIVGTALLAIFTVGSAYITYKELEKGARLTR